jgi:lysozyme family protein
MFNKCIEPILNWEGDYVNDPKDPGKETKYGISKKYHPDLDIKNLTLEKAKQIYFDEYWKPIKGQELPPGINILVLDCAINQGVKIAIICLQQSVPTIVDGIIGPKTISATKVQNPDTTTMNIMAYRALRYSKTRNYKRYGKGWLRRLADIHRHAVLMMERIDA